MRQQEAWLGLTALAFSERACESGAVAQIVDPFRLGLGKGRQKKNRVAFLGPSLFGVQTGAVVIAPIPVSITPS